MAPMKIAAAPALFQACNRLFVEKMAGVAATGAANSFSSASAAADHLVVNVSGTDRPGIITQLYSQVASVGGNVDESRVSRLAGQFSSIMVVSDATKSALETGLNSLEQVAVSIQDAPPKGLGHMPSLRKVSMELKDSAAVKEITDFLCSQGVIVDGLGQHETGQGITVEGVLKLPVGVSFSEKQMVSGLSSRGANINMLDL